MRTLLFPLLALQLFTALSQTELNYPTAIYKAAQIKANWVSHPTVRGGEDVSVLFRNVFTVENPAEDFIINISADNHYFLYVNGAFFTHGPQLSDSKHWKFETLNLKGFLNHGKNVVAVKVMNYGKRRFLGFQSLFTSIMVNGVTANAESLTTKGKGDSWRCHIDASYSALDVHWRSAGDNRIVGGFYANNPTDHVDMKRFPKNWEQLTFNDSAWQSTSFFEGANSMGGAIAYLLEPRNVPLLVWEKELLGSVVRSENHTKSNFPVSGEARIPANTKSRFLIDHKKVTSGFPKLRFSGGKDAVIKIKYAENLFGPNDEKGDRNVLSDKKVIGYYDHIISDGSARQTFLPSWMRTFRFIEFEITTAETALQLLDFHNYKSQTSIPSTASFHSDDETYNQIFEICKRTVDLCTQDYFLSDAYYETMQYVGDTKIHALIWQSLSGNLAHTQNAIRQFHHSRDAEGNLLGAYPLRSTFIFPTYSLVWVDMVADYYRLTGDLEFVRKYTAGIVHTLDGFEKNMHPYHLVKKTPYRYFIDWYQGPDAGGGTATKNGGDNSAVVSLHYVHALQNAATLAEALGDAHTADRYRNRALVIKEAVYDRCFDPDSALFAERPDKSIYDQHTNIMAILTDAIPLNEQKALLNRILTDASLLQATYYYRFYLFEAIKKVGAPEWFDLAQKPWEEMIQNHMTTTLERFESAHKPTRSEVHPWSASPAYFYLTYLAGIQSLKNNYDEVKIAPMFGKLNSIEGSFPTSKGPIGFKLKKRKNTLIAEIAMPGNGKGQIEWNGSIQMLRPGKHRYTLN